MARIRNRSSLLSKYTLQYEKNPKSRVFAPLAEIYRKLGMVDKSFDILKKGIKFHPSYTLGYIVLGNCYYDIQKYEMAYNTIRPFIARNLDNITLQKLFANVCINLGYLEEALQTFKYLLLVNPRDSYIAKQIKLLEDDLLVIEDDEEENISTQSVTDEDDWVQVNFDKESPRKIESIDSWKMNKVSPLDNFKEEISSEKISIDEHKLDDDYFHEEFDNFSEDVIENIDEETDWSEESKDPIITHTLVDLYTEQGHLDKAIEILENILDLHPSDVATRNKLNELQGKSSDSTEVQVSEDYKDITIDKVKHAFNLFHETLKEKSRHQ